MNDHERAARHASYSLIRDALRPDAVRRAVQSIEAAIELSGVARRNAITEAVELAYRAGASSSSPSREDPEPFCELTGPM